MNIKQQIAVIGGDLGKTTKMPSFSFGLSTAACKVGNKLSIVCGSVCEGCYARRLEAFRPTVKLGHERRTSAVHEATRTKAGQAAWIDAMVARIGKKVDTNEPYFRWHDSGDIQSLTHLKMIAQVAKLLPLINFWLPTKEKQIYSSFLRSHQQPSNLTIRVSSSMIDGKPLVRFNTTSTVHKDEQPHGHVCPAPQQEGECKDCRACWSYKVANISYHKH